MSAVFSIVIPVYNAERYLPTCFKSLLAQSFTDFEVVAVDDCSTDASASMVREYAATDSRIRLVRHEVNRGLHSVRKTGVQHAQGDYVLFLDPDDEYTPGLLEAIAHARKPGVDIIHFGIKLHIEDAGLASSMDDFMSQSNSKHPVYSRRQILHAVFERSGGYVQDWRVTQRAWRADLAKSAFAQMPSGRLSGAEDAYESLVMFCLAKKQVTMESPESYVYHIGLGGTKSTELSLEAFCKEVEAYAACISAVLSLKQPGDRSAVSAIEGLRYKIIENASEVWRLRVSEADKIEAAQAMARAFGANDVAAQVMRHARDRLYENWVDEGNVGAYRQGALYFDLALSLYDMAAPDAGFSEFYASADGHKKDIDKRTAAHASQDELKRAESARVWRGTDPIELDIASPDFASQVLSLALAPVHVWRRLSFAHATGDCGYEIRTVALQYWQYGAGGADSVSGLLAQMFLRQGYRVLFYTDKPLDPDGRTVPQGVVHKTIPVALDDRPDFWIREVETEHINLMIYNTWISRLAPVDVLSIRAAGVPVVYHTHGVSTYFLGQPAIKEVMEAFQKAACISNCVIALSESDAIFWRGLNARVHVLANPVRFYLDEVEPVLEPPAGMSIIYCGRLDRREKRMDLVIEAFALVAERLPKARLVLVGGDDVHELELLKEQAERLGVIERIDFVGQVDQPLPYLSKANVMIMTSPSEGFSLSLAEACSLGLPCAMFELPNQTLAWGNEGIVQVPQRDVFMLADALVRILSDRAMQKDMRAATRKSYERVCQVDIESMWRSVFESVEASMAERFSVVGPMSSPEAAFVSNLLRGYERELERYEELERQLNRETMRANELEKSKSLKIGLALTEPARMAMRALKRDN